MKQYASLLLPAPESIGVLMDLNVPKSGFRHVSEFMTSRGAAYTVRTSFPFPGSISSCDHFPDTWRELVKPLALDPPVSVSEPPTSGRPLSSSQGNAYPCAGGSWTQLFIGLLNHGARARTPA